MDEIMQKKEAENIYWLLSSCTGFSASRCRGIQDWARRSYSRNLSEQRYGNSALRGEQFNRSNTPSEQELPERALLYILSFPLYSRVAGMTVKLHLNHTDDSTQTRLGFVCLFQ